MANILIPKYSLDKIQQNFFNRNNSETLTNFISDNYTYTNGGISAANPQTNKQTSISNSLINSIMTDYGNGPVSMGLNALTLINSNVLTKTQSQNDIFGNYIYYGYNVDFSKTTLINGRQIIIQNFKMFDIVNISPQNLVTDYISTIDLIYHDLKNGIFEKSNYQITILRKSRIMAQTASRIVNNGSNN